ncbi:MAG: DUF1156 domain-containing protein [Flavobacteriales bacterium]|nr:DUF1156 domain-containing protein [Flavobacteriales bacterium]
MTQPKKLIEVAMPIKEVSAESVRDKSIRHGHISTLHLWWARRPLPVCRAVVFASLVPDPLDENCPQAFRDAVDLLLGKTNNVGDPYRPYDDIPYTAAIDKMEDNLRNRLLMFIGKFSDKYCHNQKTGKVTAAGDQLSDASLIKWDNKNNEVIIGKARKLIWVSHNAASGKNATQLLAEFDEYYMAIKTAENELYAIPDRHIATDEVKSKEESLQKAIDSFLDRMPKVFDPFAGGGAIPLEAARLGCKSYGNDINPVAHIIQKGSLEFPQKYGKPITYSKEEFIKRYGDKTYNEIPQEYKVYQEGAVASIRIPNRLSFDVEYYAKKLLEETEKEIGHFYPADEKGNKPIAYYWARVGICSNPSCKAEVPLLKGFYLANTKTKQIHLKPLINGTTITFEIGKGEFELEGWNKRGNLICPCCGSITDVKQIKDQSTKVGLPNRLLAVIEDTQEGKSYRLPRKDEIDIDSKIPEIQNIPLESMHKNSAGGDTFSWGINKWYQLYSKRQLFSMFKLVESHKLISTRIYGEKQMEDYSKCLATYLAIWLDRVFPVNTMFGRWNVPGEKIESPFARQAIAMIFDFPESNIFCSSTGSALNQLDWVLRYLGSESNLSFYAILKNASSGEKEQFDEKYLTCVITDPPYYDAIAYADLSDFFYIWLKRTIGNIYQINFATPQTPKSDECTALKHHHSNSKEKAKTHFEKKLMTIFDAIEHQTTDLVSVMFAHQSTEAWSTLCNSILGARMNITGSWPIDTEMANRSLGLAGAVLESSVTVSARPSQRVGLASFQEVRKAVQESVAVEVEELYRLGFRGPDLLTACFGKAVSEFGKYERVEKSDGTEVSVADLLELARQSAFNALLKGFDGDDFTKFYIGWLQLNGFAETDFDDAAKFTKVGLSIEVQDLFKEHILIKSKTGNKQSLGKFDERIAENKNLGLRKDNVLLIDIAHRAMALHSGARKPLVDYIREHAPTAEAPFWRVLTSISELAKGTNDAKIADELLTNKESLLRETKESQAPTAEQAKLFE